MVIKGVEELEPYNEKLFKATIAMNYFSSHNSLYQGTNTMEEDQDLDQYFDNYVPLSNLPTPPLSSAPISPADDYVHVSPSILGMCNPFPKLTLEYESC
jgi:hypothetical protein